MAASCSTAQLVKLTLTEDGTAFLERALRIVHEIDEATADMAERRGTLAAPCACGARHVRPIYLGPALYPFLAKHPDIALTLDIDDRRVDASSEGYDAIIRHGPIADLRLVAWKLTRSRRLLTASPDYLDRHGAPARSPTSITTGACSIPTAVSQTGASRPRTGQPRACQAGDGHQQWR